MLTSKENLLKEARAKNYKPEILEKVYRLLDIFNQFMSVPYLKERLVLKGGTALNLFHFEVAPRLSVDLDFNYIGQINRDEMLQERPILTEAIQKILQQNKFELYRSPAAYAGNKSVWFYDSVLQQKGTLEIDINFMYRQPLWPIIFNKTNITGIIDKEFPVLDIHELAAGKLAALFDRRVSRDLFDAHHLLTRTNFDVKKLRLTVIIYLAMTKVDLAELIPDTVEYNLVDLKNRLLPVLHQKNIPHKLSELKNWAEKLIGELKKALSLLLPLKR